MNGDQSALWGVADVDEASGTVTFRVPVTMGTETTRRVRLDQIAWVDVTDIAFD
jgi:hypothetical protein